MVENVSKSWYQSKTVWASAISVLAVAAGYFGVNIGAEDQAVLVDQASAVVAIVASLIAIYGRVTAKETIK